MITNFTFYRFFLYIDVNERISSKKDLGETWIGGYIYEEYLELYNKDDALREFGKMIPDILVKMKLPIDRNHLARG